MFLHNYKNKLLLLFFSSKGMVQAAVYIRTKLREESVLEKAFARDPARGTERYDLVLVGHSLGAGTAAILAILLKEHHPNLSCFAYSPPGGLLRYFFLKLTSRLFFISKYKTE